MDIAFDNTTLDLDDVLEAGDASWLSQPSRLGPLPGQVQDVLYACAFTTFNSILTFLFFRRLPE